MPIREGKLEELRRYLCVKQGEMLLLLERLVNIDSGSYCKEGIDECGRIVAEQLRALGFQTEVMLEKKYGNHYRAERPGSGKRCLFLSCHLDTVCPSGTVKNRPFKIDSNFAYGPGVGDMKGGIAQMIYALKALHDIDLKTPPITIFLTGDEELGSVRGRPYIEAEARRAEWVIVMEPAIAPGMIVTKRWGVGAFYLKIRGKAAHVLDPYIAGVNAVSELALKILVLEGLSDTLREVKVSINLVKGGTSRQVTASEAFADIDVRFRNIDQMDAVERNVRDIASSPIIPGIQVKLTGSLTRPPMTPNAKTEALFSVAADIGNEIGLDVHQGERTSGSDGCFTSALGVATLDGMGAFTYDICGENERIGIDSVIPRTLLLAGIIHHLAKKNNEYPVL